MSLATIIVNRRSGSAGGAADDLAKSLTARLADQGVEAVSIPFDARGRRPGVWRTRLMARLDEGAERAYVLGGDGTVLAVAGALLRRGVALGIVPLGTANLLARDLGIPLDPERAIAALASAKIHSIDVGRVNGELFLCASMLGVSTALSRTREAARGVGVLRLWGRVARKGLLLLGRFPYWRVTLDLDGRLETLHTRAMVITNNPVKAEPGLYPSRERLDLGRLGVYGVHKGPLWELTRLALRLVNGGWPQEPRIFHYSVRQLTIAAGGRHRVTVMNDGERRRMTLPLRYELLPAVLPVLMPTEQGEGRG